MENQINFLIEEFSRDNEDVKAVAVLDRNGLTLNNTSFPKEGVAYLKYLLDTAAQLKLNPDDRSPVVTVSTQNEQIVVKSYDTFLVGVKKAREV